MEPEPSHVTPSELIGYVLMITLNGKSNLRDSAEFGFLEVARGPSGQIMLSHHCHGRRGKKLENHEQKVSTEEKLSPALHRDFLILLGKLPLR